MVAAPGDDFSVLVLSGGKSSRMGADKALLLVDGETLLERTIRLGKALGASQVLISRNQSGFIQDQIKDAGPMAGITAALPHLQTAWLLVVPVDMPLLTPAALSPLFACAVTQQQSCCFAGFPLPVLLKITDTVQQLLRQKLTGPDRALYRTWQALGLQQLPLQTPAAFQNCNDPASFARVLTQLPAMPAHFPPTHQTAGT